MLTGLSDQIRHCRQRALEYAGKALSADTKEDRNEFLALQRNWLDLARSYEVSARRDAKRRLNRWRGPEAGSRNARGPDGTIVPFLSGKAFTPEMIAELSNVFDRACAALMVLPSDRKAEQIARKIGDLAQRGVRDSTQLFFTTVDELRSID
jgi:hypothetical protein